MPSQFLARSFEISERRKERLRTGQSHESDCERAQRSAGILSAPVAGETPALQSYFLKMLNNQRMRVSSRLTSRQVTIGK